VERKSEKRSLYDDARDEKQGMLNTQVFLCSAAFLPLACTCKLIRFTLYFCSLKN